MLVLALIIGILSFVFLYAANFITQHNELLHLNKLSIILRLTSFLLSYTFVLLVASSISNLAICLVVEAIYIASFSSAYVAW